MKTIKLKVNESAYEHLMFLLRNLGSADVQVVEEYDKDTSDTLKPIDFSKFKIDSFKKIIDPVQWQQDLRNEW